MTHSSEDTKSFKPSTQKLILDLKMTKFGILPKMGISGPFGPVADQKTMQTRCLGGFSWFLPLESGFLAKFGQKIASFHWN